MARKSTIGGILNGDGIEPITISVSTSDSNHQDDRKPREGDNRIGTSGTTRVCRKLADFALSSDTIAKEKCKEKKKGRSRVSRNKDRRFKAKH